MRDLSSTQNVLFFRVHFLYSAKFRHLLLSLKLLPVISVDIVERTARDMKCECDTSFLAALLQKLGGCNFTSCQLFIMLSQAENLIFLSKLYFTVPRIRRVLFPEMDIFG